MLNTRGPAKIALIIASVLTGATLSAGAMEFVWTRTTGQYRLEATPLLADLNGDGAAEIVSVNMGGQVLRWGLDGAPLGSGQDGAAAYLPEGRWTSAPAFVAREGGPLLVFASVEGGVTALNRELKAVWSHSLGAETTWARAVPVVFADKFLCLGDLSGKITALNFDGSVAWTTDLKLGPCRTILQTFTESGQPRLLVPVGGTLCCLDAAGNVLWRRELAEPILSRPEILETGGESLILTGAGEGSLYAVSASGAIRWQAPLGDSIDASINFLPREGQAPLILCAGLWGNLYAFDAQGNHVWKHVYRAKTRTRPLIADADADGALDAIVATYNQRLIAINAQGVRVDELRLSGAVNASPIVIPDSSGRTDILAITTTLVASRIRPAQPAPTYGPSAPFENITLSFSEPGAGAPAVIAHNPLGALLRVNVSGKDASGARWVRGEITARSKFQIDLPEVSEDNSHREVHAAVLSADGQGRVEQTYTFSRPLEPSAPMQPLSAWAIDAYADFDPAQLTPLRETRLQRVEIAPLYQGEIDQGAFLIAAALDEPVRIRIDAPPPKRADGAVFTSPLSFFEAVWVGAVNGEEVADALVDLGHARLIQVPPRRAVKVWIQADGADAGPGEYTGTITLRPLVRNLKPVELDMRVEVADLRMPDEFPLTLCTWDYIPNQWFPGRTREILDGMARHGVNVFPRSALPAARVDGAGQFEMDWTPLDTELERLRGRGEILFQVGHPPIAWPEGFLEEKKRPLELDYLRRFRDYLNERGWSYDSYAFYPVDEPGLDYGKRVPVFIDAAELFREADPRLRIYTDPVPGLSLADYERIEPLVDVWCPNMRLVTGLLTGDPRMTGIRASGKPVWSYECVSQVKSLSPLCYNRANAWRAYHFGLDGIGFWTFSTTQEDHWLASGGINDEYALVYPGALPVPSVRWEAVRDGLEDIAAMKLLEAEIERHKDDPAKTALVRDAQDALRIARADILELSSDAFVESRDFLPPGARRIWHTPPDVRLYQTHRHRIAGLTMALRE